MADEDVKRVEIDVGLLSGQDSQAAQSLANSMASMAEFFKLFKASGFGDEIKQISKLVGSLSQERQRIEALQGGNISGGGIVPDAISTPPQARATLARTQNQLAGMGAVNLNPQSAGAAPSAGPSPPGVSPPVNSVPAGSWLSNYNQSQSFFKNLPDIPRYGNWQINDYLNFVKQGMLQRALGQSGVDAQGNPIQTGVDAQGNPLFSTPNLQAGAGAGAVAGWTSKAEAAASYLTSIYRGVSAVGTQLDKVNANPFTMSMAGAQLGYARSTSDALGFLPFSNPFTSESTTEGLRQAMDIWKMRMMPGINQTQAQAIEQAAVGQGFSGHTAGNITDNLLAPLFQKYAASPDVIMNTFGGALRTGATNVDTLTKALSNLGNTAQAANMTINDTIAAIGAVGQQFNLGGGNINSGVAAASLFQTGTGLPANVLGTLMSNGFVQGLTTAETGLMPQLQYTQSGAGAVQSVLGAVNTLRNVYSRFTPKTEYVTGPNGERIPYTITAQQQQIGMIANMTGLDTGQVQKLLKYGPALENESFLSDRLNQLGGMIHPHDVTTTTPLRGSRGLGIGRPSRTTTTSESTWTPAISKEWNQTQSDIVSSGLFPKGQARRDLNKINQKDQSPQARLQAARSLVTNQESSISRGLNNSQTPTVELALKGQAAKFFSGRLTNAASLTANAGGTPINQQIATPQGTSYLGVNPYDYLSSDIDSTGAGTGLYDNYNSYSPS